MKSISSIPPNAMKLLAGAALILFFSSTSRLSAQTPLKQEALKAHVVTLASPEYGGRRGAGAEKAANYIESAFLQAKLEPLFDGRYRQPIKKEDSKLEMGQNLGAKIVGSDPKLRDQWIILSAHFDHLGERGGVLYPGADDNASGIAMLLETAKAFATNTTLCRRSVMFVAFDLEEPGLIGSRHFVKNSPVPFDQIKLFITADMLGRALGGVCKDHLFIVGTERIPETREWIKTASSESTPKLALAMIGTDIVGVRSDYGPFMTSRVPYLFFSTGENPCYHTPQDVPETIDYAKLQAASNLIARILTRALQEPRLPTWSKNPDNSLAEAIAIRDVLKILMDNGKAFNLSSFQENLIRRTITRLNEIEAKGSITSAERSMMVRVAQLVMASVL